jgi:hypothetical protein
MDIQIGYHNNVITNMSCTRFLGITTENVLHGKSHVDQLMSKLSTACYTMRTIKPIMSQDTLVMVYCVYFHLIMSYGIIFWGNSSYSINVFRLQKKVIRIITGISSRDSCRDHFKRLKILLLQSQYVFSILMFVVNNMNHYKIYSDLHSNHTGQSADLYQPFSRLSIFQKGTFYMGIKIFSSLPSEIKDLIYDIKQLKRVLKNFLYLNSFYTLEEYFGYNK